MERELFDWTQWDDVDTATSQFYEVVLKKDIGPFKIGTAFSSAVVCFESGILKFYDGDNKLVGEFRLSLTVAD